MLLQENIPLAALTTFHLGGPARFFVEGRSVGEVQAAVALAQKKGLALFVLGGGSNLLVADSGWPGLVLKVAIPGIEQRPGTDDDGKVLFEAGAGESWDRFVSHAVMAHCSGVECLSGIPGSVGGTPVQNVGAYGQEVSETIVSVLTFDRVENCVCELKAAECGFSYRGSIFNTSQRGRYIILRVTYQFAAEGKPSVRYVDLQEYFARRGGTATLAGVRDAVRAIRASKGMLLSPGDPGSAGSFFKNPVLSAAQHGELVRRAAGRRLEVPSYPALSQQRKVSAAWLVENSGFRKGYVRGKAGISSKHALAIVNLGGASAADIVALKDEIQARVEETWGVRLDPEPVFVGF